MNNIWVADLEANGLIEDATVVWCGVFKNIITNQIKKFYPLPFKGGSSTYIQDMLDFIDTCDTIIIHNGIQYDWPLLEKLYSYSFSGEKIDTLLWSRMSKPKRTTPPICPIKNRPHSIEVWGYRVGRCKPVHEDWSQFSMEMLHRCTEDTEILHLVYNVLVEEMKEFDWSSASWLTHRLFDILGKQERYGWLVNRDWMDFIIHMTTKWIDKIDGVLLPRLPTILEIQETKVQGEYKYIKEPFLKSGQYRDNIVKWHESIGWNTKDRIVGGPFSRVVFRPVDPNSNMEVKNYLLSQGWVPREWNTNDQGEQTSPKLSKDDPFEGIESKEGKLFAKRVQIRHRRSNVEGLIKLIRPDGRISSRVTNLAETGRATHGGIVNIPNMNSFLGKWMRKIFICSPDKTLIGTDADSCQARMLAARVNNPQYTKTILEGNKKDKTTIHYLNQKALLEEGYDEHYNNCKNLQYAFMFGATNKKLGNMVRGSPSDGENVRRALLKASPGLEDVINKLFEEWKSHARKRPNKWGGWEYFNGWITGLDGRPIFIDSPHKLLVYVLQSDEAIMMATAYIFLYDWLISEGYEWGRDWAYVCWYHDEYQLEVVPEIENRVKFLAEQAINAAGEYYNLLVPQIGEASVGRNWAETH